MGLIIFGVKQVPTGLDEFLIKCPSCDTHNRADIMVVSRYFHIFFVPFFPTEKDANVICKTCGLKRYAMPFDQGLITNYNEVKGSYRHPWFTYIGLAVIILFIVSIIVAAIL
jgi:hypothetical protein